MARTIALSAAVLLAATAGPAHAQQLASAARTPIAPAVDLPRGDAAIDAVRRATIRYRDPAVAIADGYVNEKMCVAMPGEGAMGIHFIHPKRMGMHMENGRIAGTDVLIEPEKPEILIYEPQKDGRLELVAVEWYTSQKAWGSRAHPTIFGVPFNTMADDPSTPDVDEGHGFTPHFDLHFWIYRENPKGTFAQWNPNVTCPAEPAHGAHSAK